MATKKAVNFEAGQEVNVKRFKSKGIIREIGSAHGPKADYPVYFVELENGDVRHLVEKDLE